MRVRLDFAVIFLAVEVLRFVCVFRGMGGCAMLSLVSMVLLVVLARGATMGTYAADVHECLGMPPPNSIRHATQRTRHRTRAYARAHSVRGCRGLQTRLLMLP